ncbi:MAG: CoA ester lyase [Actinomycetota bacterium]|nr:CoA ester lyase [Actinomycetota bacterium]
MPANRADMIAKIPRLAPDVAVADLEDAVPADGKEQAREIAVAAIDTLYPVLDPNAPRVPDPNAPRDLEPNAPRDPDPNAPRDRARPAGPAWAKTTVLIRVNPVGTAWFAADVAAAAGCAAAGIVVPKLATPHELAHVRQVLAEHSWSGALFIAGLETALGVADARTLLANSVSAVYFGAEDYIADIGGRRTRAGAEVLYARSHVALAAHLAGLPAIDQAVMDLADDEHFLADAAGGRDLGYQGKICIHPRQVTLSHQVFTPTQAELAHAREILAVGPAGVGVVDGQMVDDVHVRMARAVLARAPEQPERP